MRTIAVIDHRHGHAIDATNAIDVLVPTTDNFCHNAVLLGPCPSRVEAPVKVNPGAQCPCHIHFTAQTHRRNGSLRGAISIQAIAGFVTDTDRLGPDLSFGI